MSPTSAPSPLYTHHSVRRSLLAAHLVPRLPSAPATTPAPPRLPSGTGLNENVVGVVLEVETYAGQTQARARPIRPVHLAASAHYSRLTSVGPRPLTPFSRACLLRGKAQEDLVGPARAFVLARSSIFLVACFPSTYARDQAPPPPFVAATTYPSRHPSLTYLAADPMCACPRYLAHRTPSPTTHHPLSALSPLAPPHHLTQHSPPTRTGTPTMPL